MPPPAPYPRRRRRARPAWGKGALAILLFASSSIPQAATAYTLPRPTTPKPASPHFSSGPTKKRPGYSLADLPIQALGRSHRSAHCLARIRLALDLTKDLLGIPASHSLALLPGGDTGAFEAALWHLVGTPGVSIDALVWDAFGQAWYEDLTTQLGLGDTVRLFSAPYGSLPDLRDVNAQDNDLCFVWNGTTSGACLPADEAPWIPETRGRGLTICDATSACFSMRLPWAKLDVTTFSWQKAMGGEGAHGMVVLSPRALERLRENAGNGLLAARPIPKLLRLADPRTGVPPAGLFDGSTINTPSMLCIEDYLDALQWAQREGGHEGMMARSRANLQAMEAYVEEEGGGWLSFLAKDPLIRSSTSVCFEVEGLESKGQLKALTALLEEENVAFDILSYRDAPPGLRVWGGPTVETEDVRRLMHWMKWAYLQVKGRKG